MFGYINVYKPELKIKEYEIYKSYYCGLCKALKERHGLTSTFTLSYDMTSMVVLLSSLYESDATIDKYRCLINPANKKNVICNEVTEYASDMNIILTYYKLLDDWKDDRSKKALIGLKVFQKRFLQVKKKYPKKCEIILECLKKLAAAQKHNVKNIDYVSGTFGRLMQELFEFKDDEWKKEIGKLGYYAGKYIYIIDAYDDMDDDLKNKSYNILNLLYIDYRNKYLGDYNTDILKLDEEKAKNVEEKCRMKYNRWCESLLVMMMKECTLAFEKLPCVDNYDLLHNILYMGVWNKFRLVKGHDKKDNCRNCKKCKKKVQ